jgi:hypothetical protein
MARPEVYAPEKNWRRQVIAALGGDALATDATTGFLYIPAMAGPPTGIPDVEAGRAPLVVDETNDRLYFFSNGTWHGVP